MFTRVRYINIAFCYLQEFTDFYYINHRLLKQYNIVFYSVWRVNKELLMFRKQGDNDTLLYG